MISITVQLPETQFARKKWLDAIAAKQRSQSLPAFRNLFKQTVYGWSNKPDFGWSQVKSPDTIELRVYPTGMFSDIWNLVNEGAAPHTIYPKASGGILSFRPGYRAATTPGSLQSRRAYRSGPYVGAKRVNHPGFEGRKFTEQIAQEFAQTYAADMQEAVTEVARSH